MEGDKGSKMNAGKSKEDSRNPSTSKAMPDEKKKERTSFESRGSRCKSEPTPWNQKSIMDFVTRINRSNEPTTVTTSATTSAQPSETIILQSEEQNATPSTEFKTESSKPESLVSSASGSVAVPSTSGSPAAVPSTSGSGVASTSRSVAVTSNSVSAEVPTTSGSPAAVPLTARTGSVPSTAGSGAVPSTARRGAVPSSSGSGAVPSSSGSGAVPSSSGSGAVPSSSGSEAVPSTSRSVEITSNSGSAAAPSTSGSATLESTESITSGKIGPTTLWKTPSRLLESSPKSTPGKSPDSNLGRKWGFIKSLFSPGSSEKTAHSTLQCSPRSRSRSPLRRSRPPASPDSNSNSSFYSYTSRFVCPSTPDSATSSPPPTPRTPRRSRHEEDLSDIPYYIPSPRALCDDSSSQTEDLFNEYRSRRIGPEKKSAEKCAEDDELQNTNDEHDEEPRNGVSHVECARESRSGHNGSHHTCLDEAEILYQEHTDAECSNEKEVDDHSDAELKSELAEILSKLSMQ